MLTLQSLQQVQIATSRSLAEMQQTDEAASILRSLRHRDLPPEIKSQVLNNLALIEKVTDPQGAKALLLEDLELQRDLKDDFGRCITLINLAGIEIVQGCHEDARQVLEEARQAAAQANAVDLFARVMRIIESIGS